MDIIDYIWESFQFPIKLSNISCEFGYYDIPSDSIIEIHRDDEFKFIVKIYGKSNNNKIGEYLHPSNQNQGGEFIEDESIIGYDKNNKRFLLQGCYVHRVEVEGCEDPSFLFRFTLDINIDFLTEFSDNPPPKATLMEWFLTGKTSVLFSRNTHYFDKKGLKLRTDIDGEIENLTYPLRMSKDYMLIRADEFSFIVQKVQDDIFPSWANGFVIEYRSTFGEIPSKEIRIGIREIISFVLGVEFIIIGHSEFNDKNEVISRLGIEPYGDNLIASCKNICMPPAKLPKRYNRIDAEDIISKLVSNYLKLRKDLKLSTVLWKYWLAKNAHVGINLPVLSSALEGLAETYLKYFNLIPKSDKQSMEKYKEFLKTHDIFIEGLREFNFGKSVINKIQNPYNIGVGEKLNLFFNSLNINIDKDSIENQALLSRNKMSHSSSSIDSIERGKKAVRMTRAYQTLFHRAFLKVLNYDGKYIDYYSIGHPERDLSENIKSDDK